MNKGTTTRLTISRPGDLGGRSTDTNKGLRGIAIHTSRGVDLELFEPRIVGLTGADGSSSFPCKTGRARSWGRVWGDGGSSKALWLVIIVQVHGCSVYRGHSLERSNYGYDFCHFEPLQTRIGKPEDRGYPSRTIPLVRQRDEVRYM